ncbi:hypothetical protein [Microvirga solisilvae]|uniref:hypothetical protein n=1 Tax=Microvirga solisilvae TaxID=2919498 RepID=UPI001FAF4622|nr:hypothetical protein [Microvirga solisilvae]
MTNPISMLPAGIVTDLAEISTQLHQQIAEAIPLDPSASSYPDYFSEFVRTHLSRSPGKVIVLPANTEVAGDLVLNNDAPWNSNGDVTAIVVEGDLTIHGNLLNLNLNDGPMLFVTGTLQAHNLIKGGSYILVLGDLQAQGIVVGEYNDGVIRVGGRIEAQATLSIDHDVHARKGIEGAYHDFEETIWEEALVPEVMEDEMPTGLLILEHLKKGRSIFID